MDSSALGVIELFLIFGLALAFAFYELIKLRRDIRKSKDKGGSDDPH